MCEGAVLVDPSIQCCSFCLDILSLPQKSTYLADVVLSALLVACANTQVSIAHVSSSFFLSNGITIVVDIRL